GVLQGVPVSALSQGQQNAIMRWTGTSTPEAAEQMIRMTRESVEPAMVRIEGAGRVVGGSMTGLSAVGIGESGVGLPVAIPLGAWSGDQIGTGLNELWSGRRQTSYAKIQYRVKVAPSRAWGDVALGADVAPD